MKKEKPELSVKDLLKYVKGPESLDEAKEWITKNKEAVSELNTTSHIGALVAILISKGLVTKEEYDQLFKQIYEHNLNETAKALLKEFQKEENE